MQRTLQAKAFKDVKTYTSKIPYAVHFFFLRNFCFYSFVGVDWIAKIKGDCYIIIRKNTFRVVVEVKHFLSTCVLIIACSSLAI